MPRRETSQQRKRAQLADLHAEGLTARKIAEQLGVSKSTVSRWAKAAGLTFDRAQTRAATAAITADLAKVRADLAAGLLEDVARIRATMWKPGQKVAGNGTKVDLDKPDARDVQAWMTSAGIALQRSLELTRFDADPNEGASAVDAWLEYMAGT